MTHLAWEYGLEWQHTKEWNEKKDENWLKWVTLTRAASERTVGDGSTYAVNFRRMFEIFDEILALTVKNALRRGHHNISKQQNVTENKILFFNIIHPTLSGEEISMEQA